MLLLLSLGEFVNWVHKRVEENQVMCSKVNIPHGPVDLSGADRTGLGLGRPKWCKMEKDFWENSAVPRRVYVNKAAWFLAEFFVR